MQDFENLGEHVLQHLEEWKEKESKVAESISNIEEKANQIGLVNEIDTAIQQLKLCRQHNIIGGTKIVSLPNDYEYSPSINYRIVCDHETDDSKHWEEIKIDGQHYRLCSGSKIIV